MNWKDWFGLAGRLTLSVFLITAALCLFAPLIWLAYIFLNIYVLVQALP